MVPFYNMSFEMIFDCTCPEEQMEGMFHLIDGDCSSALGFPEFILFIAVVFLLIPRTDLGLLNALCAIKFNKNQL